MEKLREVTSQVFVVIRYRILIAFKLEIPNPVEKIATLNKKNERNEVTIK